MAAENSTPIARRLKGAVPGGTAPSITTSRPQSPEIGKRLSDRLPGSDDPVPQKARFTSDSTIDKLSELLADNPRGLLYCVDEFDFWLGQHEAFGRESGGRNRGEWMRLYDGGPHQVDRVKRGSFFVKNWGASVLAATTPATLTRLARSSPPTDYSTASWFLRSSLPVHCGGSLTRHYPRAPG